MTDVLLPSEDPVGAAAVDGRAGGPPLPGMEGFEPKGPPTRSPVPWGIIIGSVIVTLLTAAVALFFFISSASASGVGGCGGG